MKVEEKTEGKTGETRQVSRVLAIQPSLGSPRVLGVVNILFSIV